MKKVCVFLTTLLLMCVPALATGAEASAHGAAAVPFWMCIPFAALLLSIAAFPVVKPHWWEEHQPLVVGICSVAFLLPFGLAFGLGAAVELVLESIIND